MTTFDEFSDAGVWTPIERAFGAMLGRRAGGECGETLAVLGALLLRRRGEGNTRVSVAVEAATPFPDADSAFVLPRAETLRAALGHPSVAGRLVASPGAGVAPLVFDGEHVALHRDADDELLIARAVAARLSVIENDLPTETWRAVLGGRERAPELGQGELFAAASALDDQAIAAAAALRHRFALVTGGPGTGKTTTVKKILALWFAANPAGRVALAAPTGKAAARLSDSVGSTLDGHDLPRATTLHSLLSYHPGADRFGARSSRPLIVDLVIVDEASMIDTRLMAALVDALPATASLILLGDADQLASVDSGAVLADLVAAAAGSVDGDDPREQLARKSPDFSAWCAARFGEGPPTDAQASTLRDAVTCLRKVYRNTDAHFADVVDAVRRGDARAARKGLEASNVVTLDPIASTVQGLVADHLDVWQTRLDAATPQEALERARDFQLLCVVREDVEQVNRAVDVALGPAVTDAAFFSGRPVLVTANDPSVRLANGDVGVCWREPTGSPVVCFEDPDDAGAVRRVPLSRMPAHEAAWAMTVHKSQGSEYGTVVLLLPRDDHPLVTRELVYTGLTRARERATILGDVAVLSAGIARRTRRDTGLRRLLAEAP